MVVVSHDDTDVPVHPDCLLHCLQKPPISSCGLVDNEGRAEQYVPQLFGAQVTDADDIHQGHLVRTDSKQFLEILQIPFRHNNSGVVLVDLLLDNRRSDAAGSSNYSPATTSSAVSSSATSSTVSSSAFDTGNMLVRRIKNTHRLDRTTRQNFMRYYFALRQNANEYHQLREMERNITERRMKVQSTIRQTESDLCLLVDTLETRTAVTDKANKKIRNDILGDIFLNDGLCPSSRLNRGAYLKHLREQTIEDAGRASTPASHM
ncbi:hypothetical protein BCR43DRAFT_512859 [Syncephalastrum racemosum]|uniref:Uncharacterized protein n=1 Tax=Syncephalastrum racemosum TaxID=13706 RepID=A0A1X2HI24_SYNRA|nr:hypothetical protein BCR43DRAFT_512859 [Syncephalastrum racemosum]